MAEIYVEPRDDASSARGSALRVRDVEKAFGRRGALTHALAGVSFDVERGEFCAIMGPSGSGKTTLLNCISTIDRPTRGTIVVGGNAITGLSRGKLAAFRREQLGFVFQDANLLETLTGFENIALALTIRKTPAGQIAPQVQSIAEALGIEGVLDKFPDQMSGGERQRVAAARAIVAHPSLILADEPTGALDSRNAMVMLETLERMNRLMDATILMVTHDAYAASYTNRVLFLRDGRLFNELRRGSMERERFFARIMEVVGFLSGDARTRGGQPGDGATLGAAPEAAPAPVPAQQGEARHGR